MSSAIKFVLYITDSIFSTPYTLAILLFSFAGRDEVFVFKTVDKKRKLAKAIYLGPKDQNDSEGKMALDRLS